MRAAKLILALVLLAASVVVAAAAHDALAWRSAIEQGDRALQTHPRTSDWSPSTWLPGDPMRAILRLNGDLELRRAVRSYGIARTTPRGFDNGVTQSIVRAGAEVRLSNVAAAGSRTASSQASDLLGVLVARAGRVVGGVTADDRAQAAFTAAIERDTGNADAKYNLELLLRRTRAVATRHGAGTGSGTRGRGRKGAGAGTPGRGY